MRIFSMRVFRDETENEPMTEIEKWFWSIFFTNELCLEVGTRNEKWRCFSPNIGITDNIELQERAKHPVKPKYRWI